MRRFLAILVVCALALGVGALADDASQFVGKWVLTEVCYEGMVVDPATIGYSMELTLNADGTLNGYNSQSGDVTGTWTATANSVTIVVDGVPETLTYDGSTLLFEQSNGYLKMSRAGGVTGVWYLTDIEVSGVAASVSGMGIAATMTLADDGAARVEGVFNGESNITSGTWELDGDTLTVTIDGNTDIFAFDGETLTSDTDEGKMIFKREYGAQSDSTDVLESAVADDFIGTWTAYEMEMAGLSIPMSAAGVDMTFVFDGKTASLSSDSMGDAAEAVSFKMEGSTLVIDGDVSANLHADGTLSMTTTEDDTEMVIWLERAE